MPRLPSQLPVLRALWSGGRILPAGVAMSAIAERRFACRSAAAEGDIFTPGRVKGMAFVISQRDVTSND